MIDGLMNNEVIQSNIHSTDTFGYSEVVFAITHLLGFLENNKFMLLNQKKSIKI